MVARTVAVVSGCPDTGPAIARHFASLGDAVGLLVAGDPAPAEGVRWTAPLDLSGGAVAADGPLDDLVAALGDPHVLVSVPVPGFGVSLLRSDPDQLTDHLDASIGLAFRAARRLAPAMVKARQGRIVVVTGIVALVGAGWESMHGSAMAGLIGMSRSLARELAPAGVTVNVVAAGAIETSHLQEVAASSRGAKVVEATVARTPIRRLGTVDDVAFAVEHLASADAGYLNGVVLPVDGGLGMGFS